MNWTLSSPGGAGSIIYDPLIGGVGDFHTAVVRGDINPGDIYPSVIRACSRVVGVVYAVYVCIDNDPGMGPSLPQITVTLL